MVEVQVTIFSVSNPVLKIDHSFQCIVTFISEPKVHDPLITHTMPKYVERKLEEYQTVTEDANQLLALIKHRMKYNGPGLNDPITYDGGEVEYDKTFSTCDSAIHYITAQTGKSIDEFLESFKPYKLNISKVHTREQSQ